MKKTIIFSLTASMLLILYCSKDNTENPVNTPAQEPDAIVLSASYTSVPAAGQATIIYATVIDTDGDTMGIGHVIKFEITAAPDTLGPAGPSFNYISSDDSLLWVTQSPTGSDGTARAVLYPGTMAGDIAIKASLVDNDSIFAEQNLITITANLPDHLILTAAEPEIRVGFNSTIISAALVDSYDNPVEGERDIILEIIAAPAMYGRQSVSFNYPPDDYALLHRIEITTNEDGIAEAELFSGTRAGWVRIRADLADSSGMATEANLIQILAGPPAYIDLGPSNNPHIIENDSIYCPIACLVWDEYTNPCRDTSMEFNFECIPDSVANIISPVHGDPSGMITTYFCYTCEHAFDTVRVIAWTGELVDTSQNIIIPPYGSNINLESIPDTLYVSPGGTETSEIWAILSDDLGCLIENGILIFSVYGCGRISGQNIDTTDFSGSAEAVFSIGYSDIPADSTSCQATVRSTLLGYPESAGYCVVQCRKVE